MTSDGTRKIEASSGLMGRTAALFDRLENGWENRRTVRSVGNVLIVVFLLELLLIFARRYGVLPDFLLPYVPTDNPFHAVNLAFTMLLVFEVIELVFSMARSVAASVGKQFEILSLILLRASFKEFAYFDLPIDWHHINQPLFHILSDSVAALLIFLLLVLYRRMLIHKPISRDVEDQGRFVMAKKILALSMLLFYTATGLYVLYRWVASADAPPFFETFYTVLIFADFLLIFISLRYSASYDILFRNSGFALSTVVIRIALTAPPYWSAGLGVGAMVFTLGVTVAYHLHVEARPQEA